MKNVFLIHGWEGSPNNKWFPWLKKKLEEEGFSVTVPKMPGSDNPKIEVWVSYLKKIIKNVNDNVILVGHSIGCQAILRFLESLDSGKKVSSVILIAGFVELNPDSYESDEEIGIAKPWLETRIDWEKVKSKSGNWFAFFLDNDPYVPLSNVDFFKKNLGAEIIVDHNQGHYDEASGIFQIPSVFEKLMVLR